MPRPGLENSGDQPAGHPVDRGSHRLDTADQARQAYVEHHDPGQESDESWSDGPDDTDEAVYDDEPGMNGASRLQQRFVRPEKRQNERPRADRHYGYQNNYYAPMYDTGGATVPYQVNPFAASANTGAPPQHPRPPPPASNPQPQDFAPYTPALHGGFYPPGATTFAPAWQPPNNFYPSPPPPPPYSSHFPPDPYMAGAQFPAERRPGPRYPDHRISSESQYKQKYREQRDRIKQLEFEREEESARLWELEREKKQQAAKARKLKERKEQQKSFRRILQAELDKRSMKDEAVFPSRSEPATWGREQDHLNDTMESALKYQLEKKQGFELVDLVDLLLHRGRRYERSNEGSVRSSRYGRRSLGSGPVGSELIPVHEELFFDILDRVDGETRRHLLRQLLVDHNMSTASSVAEQGFRQLGSGANFDEEGGRYTPSTSRSSVLRDRNAPLNLSHLAEIPHRSYQVRQTNGRGSRDTHAAHSEDHDTLYQDPGLHYPERSHARNQYYDPQEFEPPSQRGPTFRPSAENTGAAPLSVPIQGLQGEGGNNTRQGSIIPQRTGINGDEHSSDEDIDLPEFQSRPRPYRSGPRTDTRPKWQGNAPESVPVPVVAPEVPTLRDGLHQPPGILRPPRGSGDHMRRLRKRQEV